MLKNLKRHQFVFVLFLLFITVFSIFSTIAININSSNSIFNTDIIHINEEKLPYSVLISYTNKVGIPLEYEAEIIHERTGEVIYSDSFTCGNSVCEEKLTLSRLYFGEHVLNIHTFYEGTIYTQQKYFDLGTQKSGFDVRVNHINYKENKEVFVTGYIDATGTDDEDFILEFFPKDIPGNKNTYRLKCYDKCNFKYKIPSEIVFGTYQANIYSNSNSARREFQVLYSLTDIKNKEEEEKAKERKGKKRDLKQDYDVIEKKTVKTKYANLNQSFEVETLVSKYNKSEKITILKPEEEIGNLKSIEFEEELDLTTEIELGIEEIEINASGDISEGLAIDPTKLNFTKATVSVEATGNSLYKCAGWNFDEQKCYGNWIILDENLIPGEVYEFEISAKDPAFVEIISAQKADHLDSSKFFVKDVFDEIEKLDNDTVTIPAGDYIRVFFERPLRTGNDITIYADGLGAVEIYEKDSDVLIGTIINPLNYAQKKFILKNLNGTQDIFDLRVVGGNITFDYIVDPVSIENGTLYTPGYINSTEDILVCDYDLNDTAETAAVAWYENSTPIMGIYLPMEGGSTNGILDYSGNAISTDNNGATWNATGGYDGKGAFEFTDSGEYINASADSALDLTDEFTVMAWINASSSGPSDYQTIINKEASYPDRNYWLSLWGAGTIGSLHLRFSTSSSDTDCDIGGSADLRDDLWHHVVGVYNGTHCYVYVDGSLNSTYDPVVGTPEGQGDAFYVGYEIGNGGRGFDGTIDDVRVYNRALTSEQIELIYNDNKKIMLPEETKAGDVWECDITPFNATAVGTTISSNNVTINSSSAGMWKTDYEIARNVAAIEEVNLSKTFNMMRSFIIANAKDDSTDNPSTYGLRPEFVDSDTINLISVAGGANEVTWQVIEGSKIYVQEGVQEYTTAQTGFNISIGYVNPEKTIVVMNPGTCDSATGGNNNQIYWTGNVTTFDNLYIQRDDSGACAGNVTYYVVQFSDDSTIQKGEIADVGSLSYANLDNAINQSNTWMYFSRAGTDATLNDLYILSQYNNDTSFSFEAYSPSGDTRVQWHAVSTPNAVVQRGYQNMNGILSSAFILNKSIDTEKSFFMTTLECGGGTAQQNAVYNSLLVAPQNYVVMRGTTSQNANVAWQTITMPPQITFSEETPSITNLLLNATSSLNYSTDDLICNYDLNGSSESASIAWYKDGTPEAFIYMPFEGNSSNALIDRSGNGNNATIQGSAAWTTIESYSGNGSFGFFGAEGGLNFGDLDELDNIGTFTLSAWFMKTFDPGDGGTHSVDNVIFAQGSTGDNDNLEVGISGTDIQLYIDTGGTDDHTYSAGIQNNKWYHMVVTYNQSETNELKLYLNGTLVQEWSDPSGPLSDSAASPFSIGISRIGTTNSGDFGGYIDEARVYTRELNQKEITNLYNGSVNKIISNVTEVGQVWQCRVTPYSLIKAGSTYNSNSLNISEDLLEKYLNVTLTADTINNYTIDDLTCNYNLTYGNLTEGVVAWFKNSTPIMELYLNGDFSGDRYKDYSGRNRTVECTSCPTWTSTGGYDGTGGFDYSITNQKIYVNDSASLDGMDTITFGAWIKPTLAGTGTEFGRIIQKGDGGNGAYNMYIYRNSARQIHCSVNGTVAGYAGPITFGNWYHVMCAINGTHVLIYVNGEFNSSSPKITKVPDNSEPLNIGNRGSGRTFAGVIDEVRIYNYELSPEQIKAIYDGDYDKIISNETSVNDTWMCGVTPYSSTNVYQMYFSNNLSVNNFSTPAIDNVELISQSGYDLVDDDLTCDYDEVYDVNHTAIGWLRNSTPIMEVYYPFEGSSTFTDDFSGNGNDGQCSDCPTYNGTGGDDGNASAIFDGSNDNLAIENFYYSGANSVDEVTVCAWAKSSSSSNQIIASYDRSEFWRLALVDDSATNVGWDTASASGGGIHDLGTTTSYADGNWHHICGWFKATSVGDDKKLYIDGVLVNSTNAHSGNGLGTATTRYGYVGLGSEATTEGGSTGPANWFNGELDDLRIYNYALSEDQIEYLYNWNIDKISNEETKENETWQCLATPFNKVINGLSIYSNTITINVEPKPGVNNLTLVSEYRLNTTLENLNCSYTLKADTNTTSVQWFENGTSDIIIDAPIEGSYSTSFMDFSGNDYDATCTICPTYSNSNGHDNFGAHTYNGTNTSINFGDVNEIDGATELTGMLWVKVNDLTRDQDIIVKGNHSSNRNLLLWRDETATSSSDTFSITIDGLVSATLEGSTNLSNDTNWHHVAFTYKANDANGLRLFVDGVEDSNSPVSTAGITSLDVNSYGLIMGADLGDNNNLNGSISDFILYEKILTPEQINSTYTIGEQILVSNETTTNDVWSCGVYAFNQFQGSVINNSNNITIIEDSYPVISNFSLTASSPFNTPDDNLTCNFNLSNNTDTGVVTWYKNNETTSVLYLTGDYAPEPFKDFSGRNQTVYCSNCPERINFDGYNDSGAYLFGGTVGQELNVNDTYGFDNISEISFVSWFKAYSIGRSNNYGRILQKGNETANGIYDLYLYRSDTRAIHCSINDTFATYPGPIDYYVWYHVACVLNETHLSIYVNGELNSSTPTNTSVPDSDGAFHIGNREDQTRTFNGIIDDLRVYNYGLSKEQIKAIYDGKNNILVSQETDNGDVWQCKVAGINSLFYTLSNLSNNISVSETTLIGINITSPIEGQKIMLTNETIYLNVTTNVTADTVWYEIKDLSTGNITMNQVSSLNWTYNLTNLEPGKYQIIVYANDSSNNIFNATRNFTLISNRHFRITKVIGSIAENIFGVKILLENLQFYNKSKILDFVEFNSTAVNYTPTYDDNYTFTNGYYIGDVYIKNVTINKSQNFTWIYNITSNKSTEVKRNYVIGLE
jgi:hypothetical protein